MINDYRIEKPENKRYGNFDEIDRFNLNAFVQPVKRSNNNNFDEIERVLTELLSQAKRAPSDTSVKNAVG